jgi:hypothetical protein
LKLALELVLGEAEIAAKYLNNSDVESTGGGGAWRL